MSLCYTEIALHMHLIEQMTTIYCCVSMLVQAPNQRRYGLCACAIFRLLFLVLLLSVRTNGISEQPLAIQWKAHTAQAHRTVSRVQLWCVCVCVIRSRIVFRLLSVCDARLRPLLLSGVWAAAAAVGVYFSRPPASY